MIANLHPMRRVANAEEIAKPPSSRFRTVPAS
jgi:hypothetical protein